MKGTITLTRTRTLIGTITMIETKSDKNNER